MREVALSTGGAVVLYDTSGPYTDPDYTADVRRGLPRLREAWIRERRDVDGYDGRAVRPEDDGRRASELATLDAVFVDSGRRPLRAKGGTAVTQLAYARRGVITPEMLYVAPELLQEALGGAALPFVAEPVQQAAPATRGLLSFLADFDDPVSDLARIDVAVAVSDALVRLSGRSARPPAVIHIEAVERAREYLAAHATEPTRAAILEEVAGMDRFTLARHFRRALGTSPDRYRTMRRLGLARTAIERGTPLALVAASTGFADQSHMARQFKRAFGLTPTVGPPSPGRRTAGGASGTARSTRPASA
jgi:AraC-like DNA-binding protein